MLVPFFQVDAFTKQPFGGNAAGVVLLDAWLDDATLTKIAAEVNAAETAFVVPEGEQFRIRWFTPIVEVNLCGHATLAAAHIYFTECAHLTDSSSCIEFQSLSGPLQVNNFAQLAEHPFDYGMSLPILPHHVVPEAEWSPELLSALGLGAADVQAVLQGRDTLVVLNDQRTVMGIEPDLALLKTLDSMCIIPTAPGDDVDIVTRVFVPSAGIDEDSVTGSAYCSVGPYWHQQWPEKQLLTAAQLSQRGGQLSIAVQEDRVMLGASAVTVIRGDMQVK